MLNMKTKFEKTCIILVFLCIAFAVTYFWLNRILPIKTVKNYLFTRYNDTSYLNIELKTKSQNTFLDNSLIECSDYKYGAFNRTIRDFKANKFIIQLVDTNVYYKLGKHGKKYIGAEVNLLTVSDKFDSWSQNTQYELEFVLARSSLCSYKINYIKEKKNTVIIHYPMYENNSELCRHEHDCNHTH